MGKKLDTCHEWVVGSHKYLIGSGFVSKKTKNGEINKHIFYDRVTKGYFFCNCFTPQGYAIL